MRRQPLNIRKPATGGSHLPIEIVHRELRHKENRLLAVLISNLKRGVPH